VKAHDVMEVVAALKSRCN